MLRRNLKKNTHDHYIFVILNLPNFQFNSICNHVIQKEHFIGEVKIDDQVTLMLGFLLSVVSKRFFISFNLDNQFR